MIVTFTDFGLGGPYLGQVEAAIQRHAPGIPVIHLFADLAPFNQRAAAYLLAVYTQEFPPDTVFLCVVDPGVGSAREAVIVQAGGRWFTGPDGLFHVVGMRESDPHRWRITYVPPRLSASFHGRDLFAPVAARLALGEPAPGERVAWAPRPSGEWPAELDEIVYIDRYGNAMTGIRASTLDRDAVLAIGDRQFRFRRTFSEAARGEPFWYENANGLAEIALDQASAAEVLQLEIGARVNRSQV